MNLPAIHPGTAIRRTPKPGEGFAQQLRRTNSIGMEQIQ
jgi:hypothetical protein